MTKIIIQTASNGKAEIELPWELTTGELCEFTGIFGDLIAMNPDDIKEALDQWKYKERWPTDPKPPETGDTPPRKKWRA